MRFGENQLSPSLIGLSPLPTAHPSGFQPTPVRPSTGLYPSFSLAMGRSLRFRVCPRGLRPRSTQDHALFRLAFAPAPDLKPLASPATTTRRIIMQKARSHPGHDQGRTQGSYRLSAHGFRFSFTRLPAFFSPFPHGTRALSVAGEYLALEGGPPRFNRDFPNPGLLGYLCHNKPETSPTGLSPPAAGRSRPLRLASNSLRAKPRTGPTTPEGIALRFGLLPFRSPLLRESQLISSPPGTEMFQFPGLASHGYLFTTG